LHCTHSCSEHTAEQHKVGEPTMSLVELRGNFIYKIASSPGFRCVASRVEVYTWRQIFPWIPTYSNAHCASAERRPIRQPLRKRLKNSLRAMKSVAFRSFSVSCNGILPMTIRKTVPESERLSRYKRLVPRLSPRHSPEHSRSQIPRTMSRASGHSLYDGQRQKGIQIGTIDVLLAQLAIGHDLEC